MVFALKTVRAWAPAVIWMGVIFFFSTDIGGGEHTGRFIAPFIRWLRPDIAPADLEAVQFTIRKVAHVTEYAILAMLIASARRGTDTAARRLTPREALIVLTLTTFYAITDEIHQTFVSGRMGTVTDVLIDAVGGTVGLLALLLSDRLLRKKDVA